MQRYERRPSVARRKYIRLRGHDYSEPGAYVITICTADRRSWFGHIENGEMVLSRAGTTAGMQWRSLESRFPTIELDANIVMPNHVHGIVILGAKPEPDPVTDRKPISLWEVVRVFKAATSRLVRVGGDPTFEWQRGYHEHVVRNDRELITFRGYIDIEGNRECGSWTARILCADHAHAWPAR